MAYSSVRPLSALLSFLSEQCLSQRPLERVIFSVLNSPLEWALLVGSQWTHPRFSARAQ